MKVLEVKRVDLWDGGERQKFGFYIEPAVSNEDIAKAYPHCLVTETLLVVYDNLQEHKVNNQLALKRRAYDKLSPLERDALGLKARP